MTDIIDQIIQTRDYTLNENPCLLQNVLYYLQNKTCIYDIVEKKLYIQCTIYIMGLVIERLTWSLADLALRDSTFIISRIRIILIALWRGSNKIRLGTLLGRT
jgi:hypothetical protein